MPLRAYEVKPTLKPIFPDAIHESNSFYEISFSINVAKCAPPPSGEKMNYKGF